MKKFTRGKLRVGIGAIIFFGLAGMVSVVADEATGTSVKDVAEHHISIIEDRKADDLRVLANDRDLLSQCHDLAGDYTREMYGGIISIIEDISLSGNTSQSIHDLVAPFGVAYLAADCPVGQVVWLSHQKRSAVTYLMDEFVPDIIAAFAGSTA
jgi:hypothetical protein